MDTLSEEYIREHCPHCNSHDSAYTYLLQKTQEFRIVCDFHALREGHILVVPKSHVSCVGEYSAGLFKKFEKLYKRVSTFVHDTYGSVASFEHGKIGQTVFHSHIHFLPYHGEPIDIVPEGKEYLQSIDGLTKLREIYQRDGQYLFFSLGPRMWRVALQLGKPRFFRDRFAQALKQPERGNWKEMHHNPDIMKVTAVENERCTELWRRYHSKET